MLPTVAEIIRDLLSFVVVIAALLITLVVVISKMPDTNPLKRLLTTLSYRLGAGRFDRRRRNLATATPVSVAKIGWEPSG